MERTDRGAVVAAGFVPWSDIGDWKAVWEQVLPQRPGRPRCARGASTPATSPTAYLRSDGRLLCVLGVTGLAVVETPDAVLVAPIEGARRR